MFIFSFCEEKNTDYHGDKKALGDMTFPLNI